MADFVDRFRIWIVQRRESDRLHHQVPVWHVEPAPAFITLQQRLYRRGALLGEGVLLPAGGVGPTRPAASTMGCAFMEQSLATTITEMNLIIILAVTLLAALLGLALYRVAAGRTSGVGGTNPKALIEPLDVLAFNNLIDPAEENFLRENLPASIFRDIQRLRLRAAIEYVMCASGNAALLIALGKHLNSVAGGQRSQQARELVSAAVQLRLLSILVLCLLWIKIAFPGLRLSLKEVSIMHERLVREHAFLDRLRGSEHLLEPSN